MGIFLGLIHHPVLNRRGEVGTTAVTNVDVHDIARAGRTYGVERFFVVTPIALQQELIGRVVRHWTEGSGSRSETRAKAFGIVEVVSDIATARARIVSLTGREARTVVTGASLRQHVTPWSEARQQAASDGDPWLLMFGTGWGLDVSVTDRADVRLPAIESPTGPEGFNHLSVRAAAVIVLDRLLGTGR